MIDISINKICQGRRLVHPDFFVSVLFEVALSSYTCLRKYIFRQLFHFQAELVDNFRWGEGIITGVAGQAKAIFIHAGSPDHTVYGQVMLRIQADEIGNSFFITFFRCQQFSLGRKINAIGTGMTSGWTTDGHMDFLDTDSP